MTIGLAEHPLFALVVLRRSGEREDVELHLGLPFDLHPQTPLGVLEAKVFLVIEGELRDDLIAITPFEGDEVVEVKQVAGAHVKHGLVHVHEEGDPIPKPRPFQTVPFAGVTISKYNFEDEHI